MEIEYWKQIRIHVHVNNNLFSNEQLAPLNVITLDQTTSDNNRQKIPLNEEFFGAKYVGLGDSVCLDLVSIETLDLDSSKTNVSTVQKSLDSSKKSRQFKNRHLGKAYGLKYQFLTCLDRDSRSQHFDQKHLDVLRSLNLVRSRLSRPPGLQIWKQWYLLSQNYYYRYNFCRFKKVKWSS
jgi:hypothetical protein